MEAPAEAGRETTSPGTLSGGSLCVVMPKESAPREVLLAGRVGEEVRVFLLARLLADAGAGVALLFPQRNAFAELLLEPDSPYLDHACGNLTLEVAPQPTVPCRAQTGGSPLVRTLEDAYNLLEFLKQQRFQIVHFASEEGLGYYSLLAKWQGLGFAQTTLSILALPSTLLRNERDQVPLVDLRHVIGNYAEEKSFHFADQIFASTAFLQEWLEARGGSMPAERCRHLPLPWRLPGPILERLIARERGLGETGGRRRTVSAAVDGAVPGPTRAGAPPAARTGESRLHPIAGFAFVGRLRHREGIHIFCDAILRLLREGVQLERLCFVSPEARDDEIAWVREQFEEWDLEPAFRVGLGPDQRRRLLREPKLLAVAPAPQEELQAEALECLEFGVPLLVGAHGGTAEFLEEHDRPACLVEPHPFHLARRLRATLERGHLAPRPTGRLAGLEEEWLAWHADRLAGAADGPASGGVAAATFCDIALAAEARAAPLREALRSAVRGTPCLPGSVIASSGYLGQGASTEGHASDGFLHREDLPLVSVCLVHHERPELVNQAVESLLLQSYPNYEVILVDDGSRSEAAVDNLAQLEAVFHPRGWQVLRQPNLSPGAARNLAASRARGAYLLFMDDDNYAKPHEIEAFVRVALTTGAEVITCFRDFFTGFDPPPLDEPARQRILSLGPSLAVGIFVNCFGDTNALVRKTVYEALGGHAEHHRTGQEDFEFFARVVLKGYHFTTIPEALYWYRQNPERRRRSHYNPYAGIAQVMRTFSSGVPPEFRELVLYGRALRDDNLALRRQLEALQGQLAQAKQRRRAKSYKIAPDTVRASFERLAGFTRRAALGLLSGTREGTADRSGARRNPVDPRSSANPRQEDGEALTARSAPRRDEEAA